jgi:hypothetical protein
MAYELADSASARLEELETEREALTNSRYYTA